MKNLSFTELGRAIGAVPAHGEKAEGNIPGRLVMDSRKVKPGDIFLAYKGERSDGHDYIPQVMEKGAFGVICEKPLKGDIPYLQVEDSLKALRTAAAFYRSRLTIPVIGITGSVGKTSTKELCAAVLGAQFRVLKTEGNLNNDIGMPLTMLQIGEEHEAAVLEMGINHFGEMDLLSSIARPDIALITAIAECHLEALGDLDGVLRAKSEIFAHLSPGGRAILNGDDPMLRRVKQAGEKAPLFYGLNKEAGELYLSGEALPGGVLLVHFPDGTALKAQVPFPGIHQMRNALGACALGFYLGMKPEQIIAGLSAARAVEGRGDEVRTGSLSIFNDCYNANPASVRAGIDLLMEGSGRKADDISGLPERTGRRIAILGDMLELGEQEKSLHEAVGEYAGEKELEALFTKTGTGPCRHFASNAEFLAEAGTLLQNGDRILLKASHGMHFEEILEGLKGLNLIS